MEIGHPPDWELSFACEREAPGRCSFSDRHFQRMDVRWRELKYVPDLDKMLDKYRLRKEKKTTFHDAAHLPDPWKGLARKTPQGWILHAGRFFRDRRVLTEVTIMWPRRRDTQVERAVLDSIAAQDPGTEARTWQAMGIRVEIAGSYDLVASSSKVGRVAWEFRPTGKTRGGELTLERIALSKYWLDETLRDWLKQQLPSGARMLRGDLTFYGEHRAEQLISSSNINLLCSLRGLRTLRLDVAWECPKEGRVYHVSYAERSRGDAVELPKHFQVRCCKPVREILSAEGRE